MAPRRGVRLVLSLIGLAVVVSMAAVVLMFVAVSRGPSVPSSATLVLRPGGELPEVEPDDVVGQVFGRDVNTVRGFVEALRRASRDDRVRAVLLMPSTLDLPYWGNVQEMRGRKLPDGSALIEVSVLAGGFLRIKRSVLEKFREKYPEQWYVEPTTDPDEPEHKYTRFFGAETIDHKFYGEDHYFSKHLRDIGIPMMIYPNVDMVHWGYKDFRGNYDHWLKEQVKNQPKQAAA